jgi:two-component system, cell cycle sensor histidine kinase and response regulator CckA
VAPASPAAGAGPEAPGPRPATEVILLVDDEDDMRALIRESLEDAGYTVLEAREGDEALLVADWHDGPIDLVITDVMMPRVDGAELARRLPTLRGTSRLLYISAYATGPPFESGGAGDVPFLAKPFTPAALLAKVREVLARPAAG